MDRFDTMRVKKSESFSLPYAVKNASHFFAWDFFYGITPDNLRKTQIPEIYPLFREAISLKGLFCENDVGLLEDSSFTLDGLVTNCCEDFSDMFTGQANLTVLNVSKFNTQSGKNFARMFADCAKVTTLNISNFNTSNATTFASMFYNCKKVAALDVSNFQTSKVTTLNSMFYNCNNLTELDLSSFDLSLVTDVRNMLYGCYKIKTLDIRGWDADHFQLHLANVENASAWTSLPNDCQIITSKGSGMKSWIKFVTRESKNFTNIIEV